MYLYLNDRPNKNFRGLGLKESLNLDNWFHYRPPQSEEKLIESEDAIFEDKILDSLLHDKPKGVWCATPDISEKYVGMRNLYWPGFLAFHIPATQEFGYCYFGQGKKNNDLPFLI